MTDLMQKAVEAALKVRAMNEDQAVWPDAYGEEEQAACRKGMREEIEAALHVLATEAVARINPEALDMLANGDVVAAPVYPTGVRWGTPLFLASRPATKAEEVDIDAAAGLTKITLRFPDEQMNKIGNYAAQRGVVIGAAIRELVETGLNNSLASPS